MRCRFRLVVANQTSGISRFEGTTEYSLPLLKDFFNLVVGRFYHCFSQYFQNRYCLFPKTIPSGMLCCQIFFLLSLWLLAVEVMAASPAATPLLIYSDITSGPNSGGENNKGIYLSVFGKNLGGKGLGSRIKLFIGGVEVDNYRGLTASKGRPDVQQLSVQIGALGNPIKGEVLKIKALVDGVESIGDLTFIVNPGRIFFIDNIKGNDRTAVIGDITHPFRHVQSARLEDGAWGQVRAGDFMVMRGTGLAWTDKGYQNYFLRICNKSGSAATGALGTGAISLMGYPGEDVFINQPYDRVLEQSGSTGAISAINGLSFPGMGQWVTVSNLRIESGGHDGPINLEIKGSHWRIVNNELTAATAISNIDAKAAGIAGNGDAQVWLGNRIHDVYCGPAGEGPLQNHGIYIDGAGDYDIGYNLIEHIPGGSGFQTYVNGTSGSDTTGNIRLHHNMIRDVGKHGINLADGSKNNIIVFNNIVSSTRYAGVRINSRTLHGARIYNNTFYLTNTARREKYGAIMNDWLLPEDALDFQNNLIVPSPGTAYTGGTMGFFGKVGIVYRNFWHGAGKVPEFDSYPQSGVLGFVDEGKDFHLRPESWAVDAGSPAVSRIVTDDYDLTTQRPQGLGFDIGAYELKRQALPQLH